MARAANVAGRESLKTDKVQRAARLAIAETLDLWIEWMCETNPDQVEELFFELDYFATATNRRRIFKHVQTPDGVEDRVEAELDRARAEEELAKAADGDQEMKARANA